MAGFVYVIGPKDGPYKIGRSSSVEARLSSLQTGNHQKLHIYFYIEDDDAHALEARAHTYFAQSRINNEWFDAPLEEIIEALRDGIKAAIGAGLKDKQLKVRVATDLLAKFTVHCAENNQTVSDAIRDFMQSSIKK